MRKKGWDLLKSDGLVYDQKRRKRDRGEVLGIGGSNKLLGEKGRKEELNTIEDVYNMINVENRQRFD